MSSLRRCIFILSFLAVAHSLALNIWQSFELPLQVARLDGFPWHPTTGLDAPRVLISQGTVIGSVLRVASAPQPVEAFRGIPYALPPVGNRRFRPAVSLGASHETIHATEFGARCPGKQLVQLPGGDGRESEDCLTLNVFRPKLQAGYDSEKLPVALYIHGGAFNRGTAAMHDTASMVAWSERPFVAVSFNYRIGALGFLPSNLSHEEGILNLGLKDQFMVMEWVQENIDKFGGDPNQVTLFGLSAGAHSIGHHVMNLRETGPLFHRVIIESGAPTSRAVRPYDAAIHETQFSEFIEEAGCANVPSATVFPCLRTQPEKTITDAQSAVFSRYNPSLRWAFQPVIDREIIPRRPIDAWASGEWNKVPIMTGFSHNEGTNYVPASMSEPEQFTEFFRVLVPRLSESDLNTIAELYPDPSTHPDSAYVDSRDLAAIQVGPQFKRVEAAYAQYAYICPVRQTANLAAPNQAAPVYLYHWALNQTVKGGANHGDHLWYQTMDAAVQDYSEAQKEVAWALHAYWTSFITTGNPNSIRGRAADRAEWVKYNTKDPRVLVFGEGNDERAGGNDVGVAATMKRDEWSSKECDFWWNKTVLSEM
ncbi:carboxylesterase family protein [Mycena rosella]|uniref:Carboxylic ester hydrolase n=1 Tax=Mycena rosella TaxID=1033263 RepID=A0AAD7MAG7_MYCRO|nr:carboxylesterase family protein [Mycena rosella]